MENIDLEFKAPEKSDFNGEYVAPEDGLYECYVYDVEIVPNNFYNPQKDNERKKYQLRWTFEIRPEVKFPEDEDENKRVIRRAYYYTGTALGWHKKNKLVSLLRDILPDFVYDPENSKMTSFDSLNDLKNAVVGRPVTLLLSSVTKKYDDGEKTFLSVKAIMKSKEKPVDQAEILSRRLEDDIPF